LNVLHISPSFYPASGYGGTIYSGHSLCNSLAAIEGLKLRVLTTDSDGPSGQKRINVEQFPTHFPQGYDVYYCRTRFGADVSFRMFRQLWPMIRWADVVHLTAVYSPPTIPTLLFSKLLSKPVMWSTRGALQRWDGSTRRTVKNVWDRICNWLSNPSRVELHVTSEEELIESTSVITNARASVIPNGIDLPKLNGHVAPSRNGHLHALFLGRLHPIKGIENLLQAMAKAEAKMTLSICGEGQADYQGELQRLVRQLSLRGQVEFLGRVDGEAKEKQFQKADLCIVPSFKENFCMVIAESLARGVPVIASTGAPWPGLETHGCGLWVKNDPVTLTESINRAASMPLSDMGQRGRVWMAREYSWAEVARRINERYQALTRQRAKS
jgi:glycosyltransferase involved in cell wall biosynthesis